MRKPFRQVMVKMVGRFNTNLVVRGTEPEGFKGGVGLMSVYRSCGRSCISHLGIISHRHAYVTSLGENFGVSLVG